MKQILVMMAAVVLVGQSVDTDETSQAAEADPIVEKAVRKRPERSPRRIWKDYFISDLTCHPNHRHGSSRTVAEAHVAYIETTKSPTRV